MGGGDNEFMEGECMLDTVDIRPNQEVESSAETRGVTKLSKACPQ